ncbi:lactate utilization protein [Heliobacterium chlorum]|uniref:Lactate utilization protein n=1 Tax=Heliobacterium chlorum TaxID=2698 RepID=A0ABR7SWH7_HELCL|nr:lactate utilization protein [Heliobacterium chlorum]MBC9782912.1 lactate utilization protein [Heliobacterium chlorum]
MSTEKLFSVFQAKAESMSAQVHRVGTYAAAGELIAAKVKELKAEKVHLFPSPQLEKTNCRATLAGTGVKISEKLDRAELDVTDVGINFVPYAVAETGSIFHPEENPLGRMVTMLPPTHIAIVPTSKILPTVADALVTVVADYGKVPGYMSFISGPSRTADIERVLTIGVHGPSRLIVILVDEGMEK